MGPEGHGYCMEARGRGEAAGGRPGEGERQREGKREKVERYFFPPGHATSVPAACVLDQGAAVRAAFWCAWAPRTVGRGGIKSSLPLARSSGRYPAHYGHGMFCHVRDHMG
jgi:hypothetical protein